jgi:hypothetical protein
MIKPELSSDPLRSPRHSPGDEFDAPMGKVAMVILAVLAMSAVPRLPLQRCLASGRGQRLMQAFGGSMEAV